MLPRHLEKAPRSDSLKSVVEDRSLENVDLNKLYESVLKVLILEYICEARFYQPIRASPSPARKANTDRRSRFSRLDNDGGLPGYLIDDLKQVLNGIAMKNSKHDEITRRSLLRFYGEMLDPAFKADVKRANNIDILVMKFVAAANKEVVKIGSIPKEEMSTSVFKQTEEFIKILSSIIQKDKNKDALLAKLEEHKVALRPTPKTSPDPKNVENVQYLQPSCQISDMDRAAIGLISDLFGKDKDQIQQDISRLKGVVTPKTLHKDVDQALFYLNKDIGKYSPNHFKSGLAYVKWKQRETEFCQQLYKKYPVPSSMKLLPNPPLPDGMENYIMPGAAVVSNYFTILTKLCLLHQKNNPSNPNSMLIEEDVSLFSNKSKEVLNACARVWRVDYPTRAVTLFVAAHLSGILIDPLFQKSTKELGPIDLETSRQILCTCKQHVESNTKLNWDEKLDWCTKDQEQWAKFLSYTYSEVLYGIKDCLSIIMSKTVKPKFGPYLTFLGEFVESDVLFEHIQESGAVTKWEKKLTKTVLRVSEASYAEVLKALPRDDTLSILHIIEISDKLVENIRSLQKRYKNPLLGYLNVSKTYAAVVTGMFASDAKNILKHITAKTEAEGEFLNYGDALEAYKSLQEIRSIHRQVSPSNATFSFDLEEFFYPHLEAWVAESGEKVQRFVTKAIQEDSFEPIDISNEQKKYSSSVHDIFTLIKQYLSIVKGLQWQNEFHVAKVYTLLMKSISVSALYYSSRMSEMIMEDLNEEMLRKKPEALETSGWFAEVKNKVASYNSKIEVEEPFNFTSRTCIGLNNIDALINQLAKLEDVLNPEDVSRVMAQHDPKSGKSYTNHVVSLRVIKAEDIASSSEKSSIRPYITLVDTMARKTILKTRSLHGQNPEWDEEVELTLPANSSITMSATVWEEKIGTHAVCGRALLQLEPRKFKHDGIPQEIFLDLDPQGRVQLEIAIESEREDAIFAMGRAHRALKRSIERITRLIVAKFSTFIKVCFSGNTLKTVCGTSGNIKPSQEQMDDAMLPLYNYLNMNLSVLAQFLTRDLLHKVMLEAWNIVISSADELLLPKLTSARALRSNQLLKKKIGNNSTSSMTSTWQSAVSSAMANVTSSISVLGFGKTLTTNEIETVISWLNFLCLDFFHNEGNGPPLIDLKTEQYQSILLIPVYYDKDSKYLMHEVDRLSPAYLQMLRDKNNVFISNHPDADAASLRSRAGSIARSSTIRANATAKARARAAKEARELSSDPLVAQTSAENIILRLLLIKDEKAFVTRRIEQRERLAHTIATERLARAAAEGAIFR